MIGREFDHPLPIPLCRNLSSSLYKTGRRMVYKREREREKFYVLPPLSLQSS